MGTYNSIFKINGKIGDYVFYTLNGRPVVRRVAAKKKGAKSKAQQENSKKNDEFAAVSTAGKHFRTAMAEAYTSIGDRYLYQRLNSLFLHIKNCDAGTAGARTVAGGLQTTEGQKLFENFRYLKGKSTDAVHISPMREPGHLSLTSSGKIPDRLEALELQVDLCTGKCRTATHPLLFESPKSPARTGRLYRRKKGYMHFVLLTRNGKAIRGWVIL